MGRNKGKCDTLGDFRAFRNNIFMISCHIFNTDHVYITMWYLSLYFNDKPNNSVQKHGEILSFTLALSN